eukprot:scaffold3340_cov63-Phaeocystis_antarctica.AAC.11
MRACRSLRGWRCARGGGVARRATSLPAAALQHGAAKRVVLVAAEPTTYGSGRPLACVQQPSGLQSRATAEYVPQRSRGAFQGAAKLADSTAFNPPGDAFSGRCLPPHEAFPGATRPPSLRCAHKRKALCLIAAPGGAQASCQPCHVEL